MFNRVSSTPTLTLVHRLTVAMIERYFVETGKRIDKNEIKFPVDTPEMRELVVQAKVLPKTRFGGDQYELGTVMIEPPTAGFGGTDQYHLAIAGMKCDWLMSPEEALNIFRSMIESAQNQQEELSRLQGEYADYKERERIERLSKAEQDAIAKQQKEARIRIEKTTVPWLPDGMAIYNVFEGLSFFLNTTPEWAKQVTGIDRSHDNGFMYEGVFLKDRVIEIDQKPALYLVKETGGSRKYPTHHAYLVRLDAEGFTLLATVDGADWALKMRGEVEKHLPKIPAETYVVEFSPQEWALLVERSNGMSVHDHIMSLHD